MTSRRNAIITGAANGLGRAFALRLARDGWRLALVDVDETNNHETRQLVEQAGGEAQTVTLDVRNVDAWEKLCSRLRDEWDALDLLINNAGVAVSGEVGDMPIDDWRWVVDINLLGVIYGCHACVDWMKRNPRGGHIINIASLGGLIALPGMGAYSATKAAIIAMSEAMYVELRPRGIGVTVVCPSFFTSGLFQRGRFRWASQRRFAEERASLQHTTSEAVADAAVRAMRKKKLYLLMPWRGHWYWWFKRLAPKLLYSLLAISSAKWRKKQKD